MNHLISYGLAALVAFSVGYSTSSYFSNVAETRRLKTEAENKLIIQATQATMKQELVEKSDSIISDLSDQLRRANANERVVYKKVYKYVESKPDCNLDHHVVGLLNQARAADHNGTLSQTPVGLNGEGTSAPSDSRGTSVVDEVIAIATNSHLSQQREVESHLDCTFKYNNLMTKHNKLIEWLQ